MGVGGEHTLEQGLNDKRAALLRGIREQTEARAVLADIAPFVRGADDLGAKELPDLLWVTDFYLDNAVSDLLLQRRISQAIQSTSELRSATRELIAA